MHAFGGLAAPNAAHPDIRPRFGSRTVRRRAIVALTIAFAISTFGTFAAPSDALGWAGATYSADSEQEMLTRINQARASAGRRALRWDATLGTIARSRSKDMIDRNYFDHTIKGSGRHVWDLMSDRGYCYNLAGENIGWNQYWPDDQATAEIHKSFMGSSGHRENIVGPAWDVVGVGAYKGSDGKVMWTVVFADKCGTVAAASTTASTAAPGSGSAPKTAARPVGTVTSVTLRGRVITWKWGSPTFIGPVKTPRACSFDVLYRDNSAPWKLLRTKTTARTISIGNRTIGHTYTLRVRARDCSGRAGSWSDPRALTVS